MKEKLSREKVRGGREMKRNQLKAHLMAEEIQEKKQME